MGLDMWLTRRVLVDKGALAEWIGKAEQTGDPLPGLPRNVDWTQVESVTEDIAHWDNQEWLLFAFSDVRQPIDNGPYYFITRDEIAAVNALIQAVLDDRDEASNLLPTVDDEVDDYDEYYFGELEEAKAIFDTILARTEDEESMADYFLTASW